VAEIVGGLILSVAVDPEAPLLGYVASVQLDMRTGTATSSSPQTVQVDAGVCHLMARAFGGGTRVGGRSYVSARRPGLAALMERFLKAAGYAAFLDEGVADLAGNGNLDNGSTVSPEQFLLDLDAMEGLDALRTAPAAPPPGEAVDRIRQALAESGGSFLAAEHTLANYRDHMWDPAYFRRGVGGRTEKEMLDQCHADYQGRLAGYSPTSHPAQTLRDLDRILSAARASLLG
jgi:trimethylamine:corrinoid methyltransferase-like protein